MAKKIKILFLFLFASLSTVLAGDDFQAKYLQGKEHLKNGKYKEAMEAFLPLTKEAEGNIFSEYAHYFYALSASKIGKSEEARLMLMQLRHRFPKWDKLEEADYLLASIYFEKGRHRDALSLLQKLKNKTIQDDADKMKQFYLTGIHNLDTLKNLQRDFSSDQVLARILAEKIYAGTLDDKDQMLLEYLIQDYKLDKKAFKKGKESVMKSAYNVAVLFPFMSGSTSAESWARSHQYVMELYEGLRIAVDSLNRDRKIINLHVYDTEADDKAINSLLNSPEMKSMDLVIGPIFPSFYTSVSDFSRQQKIISVNPLSGNSRLIEGNEFVFLFQPTLESQAGQAAAYAARSFERFPKAEKINKVMVEMPERDSVIILYGAEVRDSLLAERYKDSILTRGLNVSHFESLGRNKVKTIQNILSDSVKLTKTHHIFVASADQIVAANVISTMEISKFNTPIITRSEWLSLPLLAYEQFERRNIHFIFPDYLDYESPYVSAFKNAYISRTNMIPGTYAYQGYDMMLFFGRALINHGTYFRDKLSEKGFIPGIHMHGFNYRGYNSNLFVPVVKFENNELKVVNAPSSQK